MRRSPVREDYLRQRTRKKGHCWVKSAVVSRFLHAIVQSLVLGDTDMSRLVMHIRRNLDPEDVGLQSKCATKPTNELTTVPLTSNVHMALEYAW